MRARAFAANVAGRHGRRPHRCARVAMTLRRAPRWPAPQVTRHTHRHELRIAPRVALQLRIGAAATTVTRTLATVVTRACATARQGTVGSSGATPPTGTVRRPAPAPNAAVPAAAATTVATAPVPRVVRRAAAAAPAEAPAGPAGPRAAVPAPAARAGLPDAVAAAVPRAPAPAPAADVERLTDQVVAAIDKRIAARLERFGHV